jgi:hypothetical protein
MRIPPVPDEEFYHWYGTWASVAPGDAARFLRPELVLFMKARVARPKDDADLERILPKLEPAARDRLRGWLELVHPGHRWLGRL